ncbi:MAG: hypothetical protein AB1468_01150, partial [Candidatus Micrarchaeota archaeon]
MFSGGSIQGFRPKPKGHFLKDGSSQGTLGTNAFFNLKKDEELKIRQKTLRKLAEKLWIGIKSGAGINKTKANEEDVRELISLMLKICPNETQATAVRLLWDIIKKASELEGEAEFRPDFTKLARFHVVKNVAPNSLNFCAIFPRSETEKTLPSGPA